MTYQRKTRDTIEVQGLYSGIWECVTGAENRKEAFANLKDYRENEPQTAFRIKTIRERV